ncbi:semaphorin-4A [Megalops cyprinoides]|uniref:semaphorin-4A n=1 Tax=Megalops cyprinoides TaxID=118141 RepID=UPI0018642F43|nr:semaphorin-4A [Megalops cyprinoides]
MVRRAQAWHALVLLGLLETTQALLLARTSFVIDGPGRSLTHFNDPDVENTTTLLLSDDGTTLYVGARDSVLSLDVSQLGVMEMRSKLDWSPSTQDLGKCTMKGKSEVDCHNFVRVLQFLNSTHLYACGTFAFSPSCIYTTLSLTDRSITRRGQSHSPFDPYQRNTAIAVDGELYTGTVANYLGTNPVISRHLSKGNRADLKSEDFMGWLEDPTFVSSTFIPREEKVYFFFSEVGREYEFIDKYTVSRIAQVCTSDVGGERILQKRWTSFVKAQLLCQAESELPFNVIQDIVTLPPPEGVSSDETLFYGVFSSQWTMNSGLSAVCMFRLGDIKKVFAGNYKVLNRDTLRWRTQGRVQEKLATPGKCGLHNASDTTLGFVKENFLADQSVKPVGPGPVMVSPDQHYSRIVAQKTQAANGKSFTVLFLLTESGFLHKTVLLDKGPHIIEEIQVFKQPQSVKNMLLSITKGVVFLGSSEGVFQVPVSNCSFYWSCAECVLARDPFCAWDPARSACSDVTTIPSDAAQDVEAGNVAETCKDFQRGRSGIARIKAPTEKQINVPLYAVVNLQCPKASRLASLYWEGPNGSLHQNTYLQPGDGSLHFLATPLTLGTYRCVAVENGHVQTLEISSVRQTATPRSISHKPAQIHPTTAKEWSPETRREEVGEIEVVPEREWEETETDWVTETEEKVPEIEAVTETTTVTDTKAETEREGEETEVKGETDREREKTETNGKTKGETTEIMPHPDPTEDIVFPIEETISTQKETGISTSVNHHHDPVSEFRSYYSELVAVSFLLAVCLCILLAGALYMRRQRGCVKTALQDWSRRDTEAASPQEQDLLSTDQTTCCVLKQSEQALNKPSADNITPMASN